MKSSTKPIAVLNSHDAVVYTIWLHSHGFITTEEKRWLLTDIERARKETP